MPYIRKPFVIPVPAPNTRYGTPGVEFVRNEKGKTIPQYLPSAYEEDRLKHEAEQDKKQKAYDQNYKSKEKAKETVRRTVEDYGGFQWDDEDIPKPKSEDPKKLLQEAGIKNPGVLSCLLRNIPIACETAELPANRFAYRWGLLEQNRMRQQTQGLPEFSQILLPEDEFNPSDENLYWRVEVDRLFGDYSYWTGRWKGRPQKDWLADRVRGKYDLYFAGKDLFELYCDDHLHRDLMCPWFGDRSAARTLPRLYKKEDVIEMYRKFAGPEKKSEHLMLIFRGSGKSTWCSVYVAQAILHCPDVRILLMTATKDLAKELLQLAREKFVCNDFDDPSPFQALYPEHVIKPGKDATVFQSPLRRLKQKEKTIFITSADSSSSGKHCEEQICDDFIGDGTSETTLALPAAMKAYDVRLALMDSHGQRKIIGTPYTDNDLYATLIKRNENRGGNLNYLKVPVWYRKPEFFTVKPLDLTPDMVEMTDHSGRIDFHEIWKLSIDEPINFSRQYMCEPCFGENQYNPRIFYEESLDKQALLEMPQHIPSGEMQHYAFCDTKHFTESATEAGDESVGLAVSKHFDRFTGLTNLYVRFVFANKNGPDFVASEIVRMFARAQDGMYPLLKIMIEKIGNMGSFLDTIDRMARNVGRGRPSIQPMPIDRTKNAKANRISAAALRVNAGQIFFIIPGWDWDGFKSQALKFDGTTGHGRLDDRIDTLGLAVQFLCGMDLPPEPKKPTDGGGPQEPRNNLGQTKSEFEAAWKKAEVLREAEMRRAMYRDRFGSQDSNQNNVANLSSDNRNSVIDASGRRDAAGNLVNKWGVPLRAKQ